MPADAPPPNDLQSLPMHRTLSRQLRRLWGTSGPDLARLLEQARAQADNASIDPQLRVVLRTLGSLLERVDATYEQGDRDLHLRTRSLELSSDELIAGNRKLEEELASRNRAIAAMKTLVEPMAAQPRQAGDDLEALSTAISELVQQLHRERAELRSLKSAVEHSEQLYRTTVDSLRETVFRAGNDGALTFLNAAWVQTTGHDIADSLGRQMTDFMHTDDQ